MCLSVLEHFSSYTRHYVSAHSEASIRCLGPAFATQLGMNAHIAKGAWLEIRIDSHQLRESLCNLMANGAPILPNCQSILQSMTALCGANASVHRGGARCGCAGTLDCFFWPTFMKYFDVLSSAVRQKAICMCKYHL